MLLNSLLIKTIIQTETIVFIQHFSYLNWLKSKNLHLHSRRTVASITGKLKSHLWKISAFKLKVSVSDHNLILDHICQHRTVSSLLFSKTKQQPHPSLCVVPTCINPHLSVHPRYVSDLDIIWSFELGCNLWCCGLGGLSHWQMLLHSYAGLQKTTRLRTNPGQGENIHTHAAYTTRSALHNLKNLKTFCNYSTFI